MNPETEKLQQAFFAHVGVVLLYCQLLEMSIKDINSWPAMVEAGISYDDIFKAKKNPKETLGATILKLGKFLRLNDDMEKRLNSVLTKRNVFVHSYLSGKELFIEDPDKLFNYCLDLSSFRAELQEAIAIFHAFQRNYDEKHVPKAIIEALGAHGKISKLDKKIESWRGEIPKLFNVNLPFEN